MRTAKYTRQCNRARQARLVAYEPTVRELRRRIETQAKLKKTLQEILMLIAADIFFYLPTIHKSTSLL